MIKHDLKDQSSSNGNDEIQLDSSWNNKFKTTLNSRFQALQDLPKEDETTMEENWKGIKEALISTCQEVLGLKKHHHKEWISIETLDKIKQRTNKKAAINNSRRRTEKFKAQAEYIKANKQVKKNIRADKQKYMEELATTAEKATREGNMKQLHDTTKKPAVKYSKPERLVNDKEVKSITEIQQHRNRWVEYFEEFLNTSAPLKLPDIEAAPTDLPTSISEGKHGIQWTAWNRLEDLDLAFDMAPLSYAHQQTQIRTASVAEASASVCLNTQTRKRKILKYSTENINPITFDGETLEVVEPFTYLGSIIDKREESDSDANARISKAKIAFLKLKNK
ncbi:unnamed protein product [Schistosoma margrebowiei]|uniref:Uncharacterized protein n=1 Tax=Schistosoma margrebowiei TaxID=48269 RepID=A0A183LJR9_9TREM|nr:unnamed protein product [Schistosoma margrebowiei]